MDNVWMGRRLMAASIMLGQRFTSEPARGGAAGQVIAPIASRLMHEIGMSLVLGETEPQLPFARTRGLLRLPADIDEGALDSAFKGLAALVTEYVLGLPGATPEMEHFARESVRNASEVTKQILRDFLAGAYRSSVENRFGGLALLAYNASRMAATP